MRCLAKTVTLLPVTAVQSAPKSAVASFSSPLYQTRITERCRGCPSSRAGARAGSAGIWLPARRSQEIKPQPSAWRGCALTRSGAVVCLDTCAAPSSSAGPGQCSHSRASCSVAGLGRGFASLSCSNSMFGV